MNQELKKAFDCIQNRKDFILKQLEEYDHAALTFKPSANEWSLAQVLSHLIFAETASLGYCKKKLQAGDRLPDRNWFSSFRMSFYNYVMLTSIRIKAPAVVEQPDGSLTLEEAKQNWDESRNELSQFLEKFPDNYLSKAIYRQPVAGRITLLEMLVFFDAHLRHHQHQINRLKKTLAKS